MHGCDLGLSSSFGGLDQVLFDPTDGNLIIKGGRRLQLRRRRRAVLAPAATRDPAGVPRTPAGQLLATDSHALVQIDRDTGEIVIISK